MSIIQAKYPGFRHNDLKANNLLVNEGLKAKELAIVLKDYLISVDAQMPRDKVSQRQIPYYSIDEL